MDVGDDDSSQLDLLEGLGTRDTVLMPAEPAEPVEPRDTTPDPRDAPPRPTPGALTSDSHPYRVGWIETDCGKLGLGYAPGRRDVSRYTGATWERDLDADLDQLRELDTRLLVVMMGDAEMEAIGAQGLVEKARDRFDVEQLPSPDQGVPDEHAARIIVAKVARSLRNGETVVVVSRGGQGRTGTLAALALLELGVDAERAIAHVREERGPLCPHPAGEAFVRAWESDEPPVSGAPVPVDTDGRSVSMSLEEIGFPTIPAAAPDADADSDADSDSDEEWEDEDEDEDEDDEEDDEEGDEEDDEEDDEDEEDDDLTSSWEQGHVFSDMGEVSGTFDLTAPPTPLSIDSALRDPHVSRTAGCVLGAAIGDAIGHPTEFISSFEAIRDRFGPEGVKGYELWWEKGGKRFAPYTDDTQMAEVVLRALLWGRRNDADLDATMQKMAEGFIQWADSPQGGHRAPGNACLSGCRALARGTHWKVAGGERAGGCGSVMRAYPFGLIFHDDVRRAERWSVEHSKLTHRDPIALAASAAMAVGVALTYRGEDPRSVLSEMIAAACRYSPSTGRMMARALDEAEDGTEPEITLKRLEGWAAHEAIAAAVYLYARHPGDPQAAILEGANTPGDSDSLATLAGALVGTRCGLAALPADWVRDVERSDSLLALAAAI